jgi:hypothetical protein
MARHRLGGWLSPSRGMRCRFHTWVDPRMRKTSTERSPSSMMATLFAASAACRISVSEGNRPGSNIFILSMPSSILSKGCLFDPHKSREFPVVEKQKEKFWGNSIFGLASPGEIILLIHPLGRLPFAISGSIGGGGCHCSRISLIGSIVSPNVTTWGTWDSGNPGARLMTLIGCWHTGQRSTWFGSTK